MSRQPEINAPFPPNGEATPRQADSPHDPEHHRVMALGYLRELEEAERSIREKGFTAQSFDLISKVGAMLAELFHRHENYDVQHLFPEIGRFDPGTVRAFNEEHRVARSLLANLLSIVREIESGRIHGSSVGDLLRTTGHIVTLMRRHIVNEADVLARLFKEHNGGMSSRVEGTSGDPASPISQHQTE